MEQSRWRHYCAHTTQGESVGQHLPGKPRVWRGRADKRRPREWAHTRTKCNYHLGPLRGGSVRTNELSGKKGSMAGHWKRWKAEQAREKKSKRRHGAKPVQRVSAGGKEGMGRRVIQLQAANAQRQLREGHCFGRFAAASPAGSLCLFSALPRASLGRTPVSGAPPGSQHPQGKMASGAGCWAQAAPEHRRLSRGSARCLPFCTESLHRAYTPPVNLCSLLQLD